MEIMIYIGAFLAVIGIAGIGYCAVKAQRVRKETDEAEAKAQLQQIIALNLGSLAIAALGLIMVVMGMVL